MRKQGYKFRIYPNKEQQVFFAKSFGSCRFIYNWGLHKKIVSYQKTKTSPSFYDNCKQLVPLKGEFPWLKDINAQSLQSSLKHLDSAFTRFFKKIGGFPKFKKKSDNHCSFQIPQGATLKDGKLYIPKLKSGIRIVQDRETTGKRKTFTISRTPTGKYFVTIVCNTGIPIPEKVPVVEETTIGIDLGIKHFATLSTGEKVENPKYLAKSLNKVKRASKKLSSKTKGSNNRVKKRKRLARIHENVKNQRNDFLHKLSSRVVKNHDTICVEDLSIESMRKNRRLSRAISDVSWHEFRRQLTYKCDWYGKNLIIIGRFDPSSKLCSACGTINDNLSLSDREWTCDCGVTHDRDILASNNIKAFGLAKHVGQGLPDLKPPEMAPLGASMNEEICIVN